MLEREQVGEAFKIPLPLCAMLNCVIDRSPIPKAAWSYAVEERDGAIWRSYYPNLWVPGRHDNEVATQVNYVTHALGRDQLFDFGHLSVAVPEYLDGNVLRRVSADPNVFGIVFSHSTDLCGLASHREISHVGYSLQWRRIGYPVNKGLMVDTPTASGCQSEGVRAHSRRRP